MWKKRRERKKTQKKKRHERKNSKKEDNTSLSTKGEISIPFFSRIERPSVITGSLKNGI